MNRIVESTLTILRGILVTLLVILLIEAIILITHPLSPDLANGLTTCFYWLLFWPALFIDPINRYYDPFQVRDDPSKDGFLPHSMIAALIVDAVIYAIVYYYLRKSLAGRGGKIRQWT